MIRNMKMFLKLNTICHFFSIFLLNLIGLESKHSAIHIHTHHACNLQPLSTDKQPKHICLNLLFSLDIDIFFLIKLFVLIFTQTRTVTNKIFNDNFTKHDMIFYTTILAPLSSLSCAEPSLPPRRAPSSCTP